MLARPLLASRTSNNIQISRHLGTSLDGPRNSVVKRKRRFLHFERGENPIAFMKNV